MEEKKTWIGIVGSILLKIKNNKDIDIIIFSEKKINILIPQQNCFKYDITSLTWEDWETIKKGRKIHIPEFMFDDFFHPNNPLGYDIFKQDLKKKYIQKLRIILSHGFYGINADYNYHYKWYQKHLYLVAYLTFMFKNHSKEITEEQLSICQRIHDKTMPLSFLPVLRQMIKEVIEEGRNYD